MKLHKNLCEAVISGLDQVFVQGGHANQVVETLLQSNKKWGARDRNFIAENLYSLIRYQRLYSYAMGLSGIDSVESAWKAFGAHLISEGYELLAWTEWEGIDASGVKEKIEEGKAIRKIRESVPDWLDERGMAELGDKWEGELHALNETAPLCIRVNRLKATKESVIDFLETENIPFRLDEEATDAIIIEVKKNLRGTYAYKSGWFEIQDVSSQLVAQMLDPRPRMTVIDACAGAGGKTLHIASLMQNKGEINAIDVYEDKLRELDSRARRNGAAIITPTFYIEGMENQFRGNADRLLLDVPCSGMGVLRRNPDTKQKLTPEMLDEYIALQEDLLHRYSIMLRQGGILVYATCSIFPSENEKQIEKFLAKNSSFKVIEERKISPRETGNDGFYICKLERKN
ncbi:MAG: methyltransferase protein [Bacteroidetes bacterium]|nr:methyltransferase protein [Bacteroidota bacterium]